MTPLARGPEKEDSSKDDGQQPETGKRRHVSRSQPPHGGVHRDTAREEADRVEYWHMENIFGVRTRDVPADIKEVSHHKNRKDGSLGTDQAVHSDASTGRKTPVETDFADVYRYCAHRLLVPPVGIFRVLEIPQGTAALHDRNRGVVVH